MLNKSFKSIKKTKIIIALDFSNINIAMSFIKKLNPNIHRLKIGKEMFFLFGLNFIKKLIKLGFKIFLDLKLHDIPNTVSKAIQSFSKLKIWMISIHSLGGKEMMKSAKLALNSFKHKPPLLFSVTILSSLSQIDLTELGMFFSIKKQILLLSKLSKEIGLDGIICPGIFSKYIRKHLGKNFKIVSPGIRFKKDLHHDQKNVISPKEAIKFNIDYIVLGRSITLSKNPIKSLNKINSFILK